MFAPIRGAALRGRPESTSVGTAVLVAWGCKGNDGGHRQGPVACPAAPKGACPLGSLPAAAASELSLFQVHGFVFGLVCFGRRTLKILLFPGLEQSG